MHELLLRGQPAPQITAQKKELAMRHMVLLAAVLSLFLSGCLISEKEEVKIKLTPSGGEIWVTETGWKSSEDEESKILEDFDKLMNQYEKDELEEELGEFGVYILDKRIYLDNDKIVTEYHGLFPKGTLAYLQSFKEANEEIIYVMDSPTDAEIKTNGEILKTKKNTIIVWPSDTEELTWSSTNNENVNKKNNLVALFKQHSEKKDK
jgi:hypothetical protein